VLWAVFGVHDQKTQLMVAGFASVLAVQVVAIAWAASAFNEKKEPTDTDFNIMSAKVQVRSR